MKNVIIPTLHVRTACIKCGPVADVADEIARKYHGRTLDAWQEVRMPLERLFFLGNLRAVSRMAASRMTSQIRELTLYALRDGLALASDLHNKVQDQTWRPAKQPFQARQDFLLASPLLGLPKPKAKQPRHPEQKGGIPRGRDQQHRRRRPQAQVRRAPPKKAQDNQPKTEATKTATTC